MKFECQNCKKQYTVQPQMAFYRQQVDGNKQYEIWCACGNDKIIVDAPYPEESRLKFIAEDPTDQADADEYNAMLDSASREVL